MKYYALLNPDDPTKADNVILVSRPGNAVHVALFDRAKDEWISRPGALSYVFGVGAESREITPGLAADMAQALGTTLPSEGELAALKPARQRVL